MSGDASQQRPESCFAFLAEALARLEDTPDIRPALVALQRLEAEMRESGSFAPRAIERIRIIRETVDDDADAAYQELHDMMDSWQQWWS